MSDNYTDTVAENVQQHFQTESRRIDKNLVLDGQNVKLPK